MTEYHDPLEEFARAGIDHVMVVASRAEVESVDVFGCLKPLNALLASRQTVIQFRNRVNFSIDGYNDDPRELYEIPEVRAFVVELDKRWAQWLYFLSKSTGGILLVALCFCKYEKIGAGAVHYNQDDMSNFLFGHFGQMNQLFARFSLPESLNVAVTDEIMACFRGPQKGK